MAKDQLVSLSYATRLPIYEIEKPYQIVSQTTGTHQRSNVLFSTPSISEPIRDIRGSEHLYDLDSHGFKVVEHRSAVQDWSDKTTVSREYIKEVERVIKKHMSGVDEVHIFNWRTRKNKPYKTEGIKEVDLEDGSHYVLPATFVHIDQSPAAVVQEVRHHMTDRAVELLQGRVRLINFWQPTCRHPIRDAPLALCDGTSISDADMLSVDHVRQKFVSETLSPVYRPGFRWHYLSDQAAHECYLIKIFDSLPGVRAKCTFIIWRDQVRLLTHGTDCPHTSFESRDIPTDYPTRESIEVRAFVFTYA
ncbi:methyltransferase CmcJ [Lophiostoma macrostomum CBS 122681]|uniref:Methyltransferase CmcJ n=1 Tax=Lophiostoma macrostomum CBS 122681 TaxID=1314788 RepID=A0A6A6SSR4_9PLEO|nr:methyltransferase CmcJ [Lophiostoma macrostomum CBS 122681]